MKFTIEKDILIDNISKVGKAISNKNIIPILSGIKFELTKDGLLLTASDSELTIQSFIDKKDINKIEQEGTIIVKGKNLLEIIRKMPNNLINIEVVDNVIINIYTDKNKYSLNCYDSKEYPKFKVEDSKSFIKIQSDLLKGMINKVSYAISTQESRPLLTGINMKINGNILDLTATDSYRLANKYMELNDNNSQDINIVIPGKNLIEFEKMITSEGIVEIHIFNSKILFKYENIVFQSNLLSGSYPNTSNLIPDNFESKIEVNLKLYFDAIDRASLLSQISEKNFVKMNIKEKTIKISSFASEIGKVEEEIDIEQNCKKEIEISFSARYMMEALKTINSETILLLINTDIKPMILLKDINEENLIQIILPIKTY